MSAHSSRKCREEERSKAVYTGWKRELFNSSLASKFLNSFCWQDIEEHSEKSEAPLFNSNSNMCTQVHLWRTNRQTSRGSQGLFLLFRMPEAPSHTVNQGACVTDGLFSSHKHGTPLETAQPLSPVLYPPQSSSHCQPLHTDKAPQMLLLKTLDHDRPRQAPRVLKLNWRGERKMTLHNVWEEKLPQRVSHPRNWIQNRRGALWDWCICTSLCFCVIR